jgi:hypothetical protein
MYGGLYDVYLKVKKKDICLWRLMGPIISNYLIIFKGFKGYCNVSQSTALDNTKSPGKLSCVCPAFSNAPPFCIQTILAMERV